jgi:hypothetical protein
MIMDKTDSRQRRIQSKDQQKKRRGIGIKAFISKPVLKQEIADTIRKVLDGRQ